MKSKEWIIDFGSAIVTATSIEEAAKEGEKLIDTKDIHIVQIEVNE